MSEPKSPQPDRKTGQSPIVRISGGRDNRQPNVIPSREPVNERGGAGRHPQSDSSLNHHHGHNHEHGPHDHGHDHDHHDHEHHDHEHHTHDHPHDHDPEHHDHDHHGHSHGHHHGHHHHGHHHHHGNQSGLSIALMITAFIMVLEFAGGLLTNSLALLSDSGHMLSDTAALALSLIAVSISKRPADRSKPFGYHRFEIIAALLNGIALFLISGWIIWEAADRFRHPPEVSSGPMMLIAAVGFLANAASAWALHRNSDVTGNVNVRSAYLHILGDALGSIGALAAGWLMLRFGWYTADPLISVLVSLLILRGAWGVTAHSLHILMEGAPEHLDPEDIREALLSLDGVREVYNVRVWSVTSGRHPFTCHLVVDEEQDGTRVLSTAVELLKKRYELTDITIQVEQAGFRPLGSH